MEGLSDPITPGYTSPWPWLSPFSIPGKAREKSRLLSPLTTGTLNGQSMGKTSETQSSSQISTPGEVAGTRLSPHELLRPSLQGRAPHPCCLTPSALQRGTLGSEVRAWGSGYLRNLPLRQLQPRNKIILSGKHGQPPRVFLVFFSNFSLPPLSRSLTQTEALRKGIQEP